MHMTQLRPQLRVTTILLPLILQAASASTSTSTTAFQSNGGGPPPFRARVGVRSRTMTFATPENLPTTTTPPSFSDHLSNARAHDSNSNRNSNTDELFAVAPMMGHTHKHHHFYARLFTNRAHLYTEMIPSAQIVRAHQMENPTEAMNELIGEHSDDDVTSAIGGPVTLQMGGADEETLYQATYAVVSHTRSTYHSINLNCGCPSKTVSGTNGYGAALMDRPERVYACVQRMRDAVRDAARDVGMEDKERPEITVKHRLGIHELSAYDRELDVERGDEYWYHQVKEFIRTITSGDEHDNDPQTAVRRLQVHARIGLLGDFDEAQISADDQDKDIKIDHKRVHYQKKKQARAVTITNRSAPPLRPEIVHRLALEFPHLSIVCNGGIRSFADVRQRLESNNGSGSRNSASLAGVMVGRAAINHPCALLSPVDQLYHEYEHHHHHAPSISAPLTHQHQRTRGEVLHEYIAYCRHQESIFNPNLTTLRNNTPQSRTLLFKRQLVSVPFHLFTGEDGNNPYQRRIRKLSHRKGSREMDWASRILGAALAEVPTATLEKPIGEFVDLEDIPTFEFVKRAGPLQRHIW